MVPWSGSQTSTLSPATWFRKLFTKGLSYPVYVHDDEIVTKKLCNQVSGILEVDTEPPWRRRILLVRNSSEDAFFFSHPKEFGFYIREGVTIQAQADSLEKVPGLFVSRLVPGSQAEISGLISVDDELLDVNGMDVAGKTIDEVTAMLTAHGMGVILTLKPVTSRIYDRTLRRSRLSLSAPTPRKCAGRSQPRPQTPLLATKTAEIRYAHEELHKTEDLQLDEPPQVLIPWLDPSEDRD